MVQAFPADSTSTCNIVMKKDGSNTVLNYSLAGGATHNAAFKEVIELARSETNRIIDLTLLCNHLKQLYVKPLSTGAGPIVVGIKRTGDTDPPVMADSGIPLAAGGMFMWSCEDAEGPPALYLDNEDAAAPVLVEIGGFGSFDPYQPS